MPLISDLSRRAQMLRLRARWILPVSQPPIRDGEIVVEDGVITYAGRAQTSKMPDADLGLVAILPGFVNVHSHLEYTVFRGLLEDIAFFPWIRNLTALKAHLSREDWTASATLGAAEMLAAGITTVADCADAGASLLALIASGQRGIVYREVFGIEESPSVEEIVRLLRGKVVEMNAQVSRSGAEGRVSVGISPHAPYTVRPALLSALSRWAQDSGRRQAIHVGESPAEAALIEKGEGPFAEMFGRRGIVWPPMGVSPVRYVAETGAFNAATLAIHAVQTDAADAKILKEKSVAVAHCPRSNGKLGAGFAPLSTLLAAGVPVGLGTDSVASNNSADMFEEMRTAICFARARAGDAEVLGARSLLRLATLGGATALGLEKEIGTLSPGKKADLCVVRLDGLHLTPAADDNPEAALVYGARASDVAMTMVGGRVLYESGNFFPLDVGRLRTAVHEARAKLSKEAAKL